MFYWVLSHRDINRAFKRYICKCTNVISLAVSFVPLCYGWWGWAQSRRDEAAPMVMLIVHRLIEPCACVFLFEHCMKFKNAFAPDMYYVLLPPPAQGIWDSLLTSAVNPHLQLLSIQRQELILIPLLWAGRSVACLLSPPKSLWTDGALWLGKLREEGVSGDRNSRSSLGVFFPPKQTVGITSATIRAPSAPCLSTLPCTVLPSVRSGHGVIAQRKILSLCQEDLGQVLETLTVLIRAAKQEGEIFWHPEPVLGFLRARCALEKHNKVINSMHFNRKTRVIVRIYNLPGWGQGLRKASCGYLWGLGRGFQTRFWIHSIHCFLSHMWPLSMFFSSLYINKVYLFI